MDKLTRTGRHDQGSQSIQNCVPRTHKDGGLVLPEPIRGLVWTYLPTRKTVTSCAKIFGGFYGRLAPTRLLSPVSIFFPPYPVTVCLQSEFHANCTLPLALPSAHQSVFPPLLSRDLGTIAYLSTSIMLQRCRPEVDTLFDCSTSVASLMKQRRPLTTRCEIYKTKLLEAPRSYRSERAIRCSAWFAIFYCTPTLPC